MLARNLKHSPLRLKLPPLIKTLQLLFRHLLAATLPNPMPDTLRLHRVLVSFFQRHGDSDHALHGALGGDLDKIIPRRGQRAVEVDGVDGDGVVGGGVVDVEDAEDGGFGVEGGAPVEEGYWGGGWVVDCDVDGEVDGLSRGGRDGREGYLEVCHYPQLQCQS